MSESSPPPAPSSVVLRQMIDGYRISQLLYVVAALGIADLLTDGAKEYTELAQASGAHPPTLLRLLRALAGLGIFTQSEGNRFGLNEAAAYLTQSHPQSLKAWAIFSGSQHYPAWSELLESAHTGEVAFERLHEMSVWEYRAQHPQAREAFDRAIGMRSTRIPNVIAAQYDFARFQRVVDVGGGRGVLLAVILKPNPSLRGVLFDLAQAMSGGEALLRAAGVAERCEFMAGNFLERVSAAGDCFILSRVLHDWDDERALQILANCRAAMAPQQTLLIIERVLDAGNPDAEAALADLSMMVMNGGRERTRAEFETLLAGAGFEWTRDIPTETFVHIVEAKAL